MKLYRNAIILVVVIALLGGAYYFAGKLKKPDNSAPATDQTIKVTDFTSDKVKSVTLENSDGTFVIVKKDTNWVLSSPADFKADSSKLSSVVINLGSVIADKLVEADAKDLSIYGLDKPVQVSYELTDGTKNTLLIGSETPTKSGYYVKLKNENKVYVVGSYTADAMLVKKNDMRDKTLYTLKSEDVISLSMDRKGENVFKAQKGSDSNWSLTAPIQGTMSAEAFGPMLDALSQTAVNTYVEENPADLGKYGLANPAYALEFATSSAHYKLLLGNEKVKGSEIYAMLEGSNMVFTINDSAYSFLDKPLKEIIDVFAYIVNIDQVNKIELTMDGQTTTFGLDVYKDKDGKTDTDKDKFTVNGKDASGKDKDDKQPFRTFYQSLIGISLDDIDSNAVPTGSPEITITYYLKSAPGTMKVEFIPKDSDYDYVVRNGKYTGVIVKKSKGDMGIAGMKASYKTLMDFMSTQK